MRDEATFRLHRSQPYFSAMRRFNSAQLAALVATVTAFSCLCWFQQFYLMAAAAALTTTLFFLSVVALRLLVLLSPAPLNEKRSAQMRYADLPTYTVLVPLYGEPQVLEQLLSCLAHFDYPPDKLDIKIILEQDDLETRTALAAFSLPAHFETLVVPRGAPQTKPRALNYALQFARGELLTIYDAEDLPQRGQLRQAAERFNKAPNSLACLQARLAIYNANENWLTRQFALEYAMLFSEILPSLAALGLPLPLGGTSNHFRTKVLRDVGGWDAFNVTEDADLGLRLARTGCRTSVLESDTFEEACVTRRARTRQRARWLKGFLQTWLVHMRQPVRCWRELGAGGFWVLQTMTLGVFVSALVHPLSLFYVAWQLSQGPQTSNNLVHASTWLSGMSLAVFFIGYGTSLLLAARTIRRNAMQGWWSALFTLPAYWLLMMPAAWLALYQFITDVHGWNKTEHCQSKLFAEG